MARPALAEYVRARAALIESARPGTTAARALSDLTDRAVSALAEAAFGASGAPWALVALGGYGAGRLLPHSDLDLLVLTEAAPGDARPRVEAVLYPLWDAGLEVGHAVRGNREHRRACRDDIETLTASLSARVIAGDARYAAAALDAVVTDARRRGRAVGRQLASRDRGGSPYDLWPDLKDGAGGQRDLDEIRWRSALRGAPAPGLAVEQDVLDATRWRVHIQAGRKAARLTPDVELPDGPALHAAMAAVHEAVLAARGCAPAGDGTPLAPETLMLELSRGPSALPALERIARLGGLDGIVPGFSALMTLRRPALSHRLTVGSHTLLAAALLGPRRTDDRLAAALIAPEADHRLLIAATLAHDAGKADEGAGHPERGVPAAAHAAAALGLDALAAADAGTLVREHLLLAETAAYSDIDDEDVVLSCAARIGRRDLVGPLYLLTLVDSLATGPGAWDDWHASLVRTLVGRVDAALSPRIDGAGMVRAAEETRARARELMRDATAAVRDVLEDAPLRYLASRSAEDVAADMAALGGLGPRTGAHPFDLRVQNGPVDGTFRVSIAAYDRPGLFALLAGSLSVAGLDILAAEANTGANGAVLDTFTVRSATLAPVEHATWARAERAIAGALARRLDIATRLAERRGPTRPSRRRPRVQVDTGDPLATVLTVRAADRPGLLHDVARVIADLDLTILWAKASGSAGEITDVFRIVDPSGAAPRDPGELGHLSMRVREALRR